MYARKDPEDAKVINNKLIYPLLENDVLLDGQLSFASKLQQDNIKVDHFIINDAKHGFMTYGNKHEEFAFIALDKIKAAKSLFFHMLQYAACVCIKQCLP